MKRSTWKKSGKLLFLILSSALVIILSWYTFFRIMSQRNATKVYEIHRQGHIRSSPDKDILKIGSFNIAHGRGKVKGATNWQERTKAQLLHHLEAIAKQIQEANLDIIVLNEVDFSAAWSFHVNQVEFIATQAGYQYVAEQRNIDVSFPFYNFKFGNAILSHYPIVDDQFLNFPPYSQREDIFAGNHDGLLSVIQTPRGQIGVVAIHLEYRSEDIRVLCARQLEEFCRQFQFPIIAAGDFNSTPIGFPGAHSTTSGMNAITYLLSDGGFNSYSGISRDSQYYTFPSEQPEIIIDWVLGKGDISMLDLKVVHSHLSDHSMITAKLQLEPIKK